MANITETNRTLPNPYRTGAPISGQLKFIGRKQIINDIVESLDNKRRIVLYGQRRVGKSSILHQIEQKLEQSIRYMPVYIDLQGQINNTPLDELITYFSEKINELCHPDETLPSELLQIPREYFKSTWLRGILSKLPTVKLETEEFRKSTLVLLLDEFDDANQGALSQNASEFYTYLSDLLTDHYQLQIIVVLSHSPDYLSEVARKAIKDAGRVRVSLMTKQEINDLTSLSEPYLKWSVPARDEIWNLTRGHPFLAQSLCTKVWERQKPTNQSQAQEVTRDDIEQISQNDEFTHFIDFDWKNLYPQEHVLIYLLSSCPKKEKLSFTSIWNIIENNDLTEYYVSPDQIDQKRNEDDYLQIYSLRRNDFLKSMLDNLVNADWVESSDSEHRWVEIKTPIFRRWIVCNHKLDSLINELVDKKERAKKLFIKASQADNDDEAINTYEKALRSDPENEKILATLTRRLNNIIEICIKGDNYQLAKEYATRLLDYDSNRGKQIINRINNKIQTSLILRKISVQLTNHQFLSAYQQVIMIGDYDEYLQFTQIFVVTLKLLYFSLILTGQILLNWLREVIYWLPLIIIIDALRRGILNPKETQHINNSFGLELIIIIPIIIALINTYQQRYTYRSEESSSETNWWILTLASLTYMVFIILPNSTGTNQPGLITLLIFIIPTVAVAVYILKRVNELESIVLGLLLSILTYGACSTEGVGYLTNFSDMLQSGFNDVNSFFSELRELMK